MPGRPRVAPYLHGISDWEPPQTQVAWRSDVWELQLRYNTEDERKEWEPRDRIRLARYTAELLEDYPLKAHELLNDRSDRVFNALKKLVAAPETPVWLLDDEGAILVTSLGELIAGDKETLYYRTVLLPPEAGGLGKGLLDAAFKFDPTRSDYDVADEWHDKHGPLRQRKWDDDTKPAGMKLERIIPIRKLDDDDAEPTKTWYWFVRPKGSDSPNARGGREYALEPHLVDAKAAAEKFVGNLALDADLCRAVILAAEFHDLGKDRKLWQQGIGNRDYPAQKWAKSGRRIAVTERSTYRHEFGSLFDVTERAEFQALKPDLKELVLHLIAAHHGRARPHFPEDEAFDHEPKGRDVSEVAAAVPRRFAKLQQKYGRWGLAYLESLVRAADILASRKAEEGDS